MSAVLFVQKYLNEHVAHACCELVLPPLEVLKEVKALRKKAFDNNSSGYEMGMRECPNCKQLGLFVHDGNLAKCNHPDHDEICAEINKKADDEAREAARNASKPRKRKCLTCACSGWFKPGDFKPAEGEDPPTRCDNHSCLSTSKLEISCEQGQCDGCLQVFCSKCDRCK